MSSSIPISPLNFSHQVHPFNTVQMGVPLPDQLPDIENSVAAHLNHSTSLPTKSPEELWQDLNCINKWRARIESSLHLPKILRPKHEESTRLYAQVAESLESGSDSAVFAAFEILGTLSPSGVMALEHDVNADRIFDKVIEFACLPDQTLQTVNVIDTAAKVLQLMCQQCSAERVSSFVPHLQRNLMGNHVSSKHASYSLVILVVRDLGETSQKAWKLIEESLNVPHVYFCARLKSLLDIHEIEPKFVSRKIIRKLMWVFLHGDKELLQPHAKAFAYRLYNTLSTVPISPLELGNFVEDLCLVLSKTTSSTRAQCCLEVLEHLLKPPVPLLPLTVTQVRIIAKALAEFDLLRPDSKVFFFLAGVLTEISPQNVREFIPDLWNRMKLSSIEFRDRGNGQSNLPYFLEGLLSRRDHEAREPHSLRRPHQINTDSVENFLAAMGHIDDAAIIARTRIGRTDVYDLRDGQVIAVKWSLNNQTPKQHVYEALRALLAAAK